MQVWELWSWVVPQELCHSILNLIKPAPSHSIFSPRRTQGPIGSLHKYTPAEGRGTHHCGRLFLINLRPEGGLIENSPSPAISFFSICQKTAARAPLFLAHLNIHLFRIDCKNLRRRSRKVRSPGHVKWPHIIKSLNARQSYNDRTVALKLSAIDTVSIKCIAHNFDIDDLRSSQFCDPSIISQCEKIEKHLFCTKPILNILKHRFTGKIYTLTKKLHPVTLSHDHKVISGHERSPAFLPQ